MIAKAIVQRWPITPKKRAELIERLHDIATDTSNSPREAVAAARAIFAAEAQNINDEQQHAKLLEADGNRILSAVAKLNAMRGDRVIDVGGSGLAQGSDRAIGVERSD